jgi:hypothetical protein
MLWRHIDGDTAPPTLILGARRRWVWWFSGIKLKLIIFNVLEACKSLWRTELCLLSNRILSNRWVFTVSVVWLFDSESGLIEVFGQWMQHKMCHVVDPRVISTSCYWSDKGANRDTWFQLHVLHRLYPTHINFTFRNSSGKVQYWKIWKVKGQVSCDTYDRKHLASDLIKYDSCL